MTISKYSAFTALMLLCSQVLPSSATIPTVNLEMRDITAQDFKALALTATSGQLHHGGKRALLQSSAFSQDFFNILEPILVGDTSELPTAQLRLPPLCAVTPACVLGTRRV